MRGEYVEAESLFIRAVATLEELPGQPHLAPVLTNFARFYSLKGQLDRAEALCRRALDLQSHNQPRDELGIADSLECWRESNLPASASQKRSPSSAKNWPFVRN
jgi:Tfp pilus assembly protein PilF